MKYWAFISYSHADQRWAEWLHRSLETYRLPRSLVGKETEAGKVPPRVYPIFRDRDELRAAADLGANIEQGLEESRALIVICSPAAVKSRWVGEEIKAFKKLGRENSILGLIVDGEPNVSAGAVGLTRPDECFPAALRFRLGADGELSSEPTEPLAADLRDDRDGKNGAKLKLLASLLSLNFDDLRRRDHERRLRRARALGAFALTLLIIFAALTIWAMRSERQTQRLLVASDSEQAEDHFQDNNAPGALAFLARATARDPDRKSTAATRLWFALTQRSWPVPISEPMYHTAAITSARFAADEHRLFSASEDKTVRIWDADSGKEIRRLDHEKTVRDALFTKDGKKVISICDDAKARVWDANSGASSVWPEHPDKITSLALSAREQFVATGSFDGTLRVSRLTSGEKIFENTQPANVHTVAFHPSDENLFLSISGNSVTVWNLAEKATLFEIAHTTEVKSASFSPKGDSALTSSSDGTVRLTDVSNRKVVFEKKYDEPATHAVFSPNGHLIAVAIGQRVLFHQVSGEALPNSLDCEQPVSAMKFSPDNRALYVGGDEGIVQAWDVESGQAFGESIREIGGIVSVDLTNDGRKLLVATGAGSVRVWQRPPRNPVADLWKQDGDVGVLAVSPKGDRLFLASKESGRLWDLSDSQVLPKIIRHESEILCATFSPDGKYLLTGSVDETAHVWLAASGDSVGDVSSHQGSVIHVAFHPGGAFFVTATESGVAQLWETASRTARGKEITHEGKITSVDFEANGKRFLTAAIDGRIKLWRSDNAEDTGLTLLASGEFSCARFSPTGDRIATGLSDGTLQLWSSTTGQQIGENIFLKDSVSDLAFSPDSQLLATSSRDSVSLWNATDGSGREELPNQAANISAIAFSPDSNTIATASEDGIGRLWDAKTGRPLSETLRHPGLVRGLAFNREGTILFCAAGNALRAWEATTGLTSSDHASLATLACEFSSVTLLESARLQPRVMASLHKLRELGTTSTGHVGLLTNWLCSTPAERTLSPFSRKKLAEEIAPLPPASPNE